MNRLSNRWITPLATAFVVLWIATRAIGAAQDHASAEQGSAEHHDPSHPVLSEDTTWAGSVVIVIIGMFVAAAVIGPIVRANLPEDVPLAAHDEPPGASHHHGRSGTLEDDHGPSHGH